MDHHIEVGEILEEHNAYNEVVICRTKIIVEGETSTFGYGRDKILLIDYGVQDDGGRCWNRCYRYLAPEFEPGTVINLLHQPHGADGSACKAHLS